LNDKNKKGYTDMEKFDFVEMPDGSGRTDYPDSLGFGNERLFKLPLTEEQLRSLGGAAIEKDGEW